jgi:hypothetical protein
MTKLKYEKKAAVLAYFRFLSWDSIEWRKTVVYKSNDGGRDFSWNTQPVH